ncbi:hypothetical protein TREMEDRAFT_43509 [Tremella mesenterica DSM 1558]|uniref:uncharacterized protein n=1 Tax=Tremella mesenterica (strain ATCC 24925 / CBS 8224 / DSM 1558 / NBRC 9311 / NRRL Y-6157 / RJB 2259-6 / UBC 559-6) TaxID=578456 RepID=UPI0003F49FBF|nr:uncharacterized protein TREMEDRAFT_43509 [Tremella mesenterica DSM 1558]EIW69832.1 hypothetical protein TREMEDRAFT_43509 [Tremella mesenterica DSM 1558]
MPSAFRRRVWLLLAATLTLQLVITRSVRVLKHDFDPSPQILLRRSTDHASSSLLHIPYEEWYSSAPVAAKPFILLALSLVLCFLFSFIGISASDFFCPNLSTIATYLGLSESTAGVTFLAFGNGSPDVFSTFSALKNGTFGLAIGELIGAATFSKFTPCSFVSIVVGSIAFIRPFHVPRYAFARDVTFFTLAVVVLITVLHDGSLTVWESGGMVLLYVAYVGVIVTGNWFIRRRHRKTPHGSGYLWQGMETETTPRPPSLQLPSPRIDNAPEVINPTLERNPSITALPPTSITEGRSRSPSIIRSPHLHALHQPHEHAVDTPRATFSLLGAIEFRDVVNSLRRESQTRTNGLNFSESPTEQNGSEDYFGPIRAYNHRRTLSSGLHRTPSADGTHRRTERPNRPRASSLHPGMSNPVGPSRTESTPIVPSHNPIFPRPKPREHVTVHPQIPEPNPWSDQRGFPPTPTSPTFVSSRTPSPTKPERPKVLIPQHDSLRPTNDIPVISVTDPFGAAGVPSPERSSTTMGKESPFRFRRRTRIILRVLFPSLQSFRHKSVLGMVLAVVCVPAILALTVTLPVVDDGSKDEGGVNLPEGENEPLNEERTNGEDYQDGHEDYEDFEEEYEDRMLTPDIGEELHHLVDNGFSPLHSPLRRISHSALRRMAEDLENQRERGKEETEEEEQEEALDFQPVLTALQCVLGPLFCTLVMFHGLSYMKYILLGVGIAGILAAILVLRLATDGTQRPWRLVRCFAGFICSMVWIAAIADEVVRVLGAIGEILGLSDAIIGLTIFAVGNSLADLVANVTVAQFAPAMAYAACFGGPMLNLLLGVGGSGTYSILATPYHLPVKVDFSPTLWVSASGLVLVLLATAIFVPLNGYLIDRRWACVLIGTYCVLMGVNVGVEVTMGRD